MRMATDIDSYPNIYRHTTTPVAHSRARQGCFAGTPLHSDKVREHISISGRNDPSRSGVAFHTKPRNSMSLQATPRTANERLKRVPQTLPT